MSTSVLLSPAPGWYPDPAGHATYRWWDGDDWTEGTHGPTAEPVQPVPPVELVPPVQTLQPVQRRQPAPRRGGSPAKTRWSSLLVAFPFLYPFAVGMVVALAYAGGAASNTTALIVIGAIAAIACLVPAWVLADYDRRELVERGYEPAPSIGWMLLAPPIGYLVARRRVVGPSF